MNELDKLIDAVEFNNEAAAKLAARKLFPEHAADMGRAFNGSIDAAKRVHDALLPDMGYWLFKNGQVTLISATICTRAVVSKGEDGNAGKAWLLAILRALNTSN